MRIWIPLTALVLLAGCASSEQIAARDNAQRQLDERECQQLGFSPATEPFANCLLRLKEIRAQEANTDAMRRANTPDPWGPWGPWGYRPYRY
ncbi:MAG: hypothetical protein Q7S99_11140 [Parvibaculum sp.]|nr:hypothetical protein [Parvibaculum sp.]|tara:strand:+ start:795 stop:1070 length:276 start_codon:yes stop_codon:yes gene_type:complete